MIRRFWYKYKQIVVGLILVLLIGGLIYIGVTTQNNQKETEIEKLVQDTFPGVAMGTAVKMTIYSESNERNEQINQVLEEALTQLEQEISVRISDSDVYICNNFYKVNHPFCELSEELLSYLQQELEINQETDGAFSPCIRPIAELWGIESGKNTIPAAQEIEKTLENTKASDLEITQEGIIFHHEDMQIDFGATGKGIACDQAVKKLEELKVPAAVVSIGGSIAVYGSKGKRQSWHIGIQDPRGVEGDVLGVLNLSEGKMISTSGDYEKYFEQDGKRYHHIFDPSTGYPAESGLISVTIVSDSGFLSDALSTACFVMGLEKGMEYAEQKGVEAIFVTEDKEVYVTKEMSKHFVLQAEGYKLGEK